MFEARSPVEVEGAWVSHVAKGKGKHWAVLGLCLPSCKHRTAEGSFSCRRCFSHFGSTASPYSHHPKPGLEENEQPAPWGERKMKWILVGCLKAWNNLHCCNCSRRDSQNIPFNISVFCFSCAGSQDVFSSVGEEN